MYCEDQYIPYEAVEKLGSGKVLILAPHPDDEVFGCAGTIVKHVESGDPVQVVIVSDGGYLESGSKAEYIQRRKQESIQAGNLLGYTPEFWDIPDREVVYGEKLIARIGDVIDTAGIDLVYAPSVTEIHPDHQSLGMAVAEAARRSKKKIRVAFYEVGIPLQPNRLLDITDVMNLKQKAMACFSSQLQQQKYDRHIAALNQFRTYTLPPQVQAAEAYFVIDSEQLSANPLALYHSKAEKMTFPGSDVAALQNNLVTVIIRSIGRENLLAEALASVALQTYPHIEVLVVNAKGEGHPALEQWCGRFPLRVCGTGEPLPRSRAANLGLKNARGNYLIFLDDDDLFYPDHAAHLIKALEKNPGASAAYSGVLLTEGSTGNDLSTYNMPYNPLQLLGGNYIPIHAIMFHQSLLESGCRFDENLDIFEDWDFWLQISQHTEFIHVNLVTAQYRIYDNFGSNVQNNSHATHCAKLSIYNKWREKWSDEQLLELMQSAYEKPSLVKEISAKNTAIDELKNEIDKRNVTIHNLQNVLAEKDATIHNLQNVLAEKDATIHNLQNVLAEKDATIHNLQT
ncbi:MAG: PIG-L family deacetylase, partial [Desulfobulbaceae bacterium]|nr:PIG-L family deacetylase [Desulfobulbaceae bacterium]